MLIDDGSDQEPHGSSAKESQPADITDDPNVAPRRISFKQCVLFWISGPPILRSFRKYSAQKTLRSSTPYPHDVRRRTLLYVRDAIAFTQIW